MSESGGSQTLRPKRHKKSSTKQLNELAAGLNVKTVEDYIYNVITDIEHPAYCDVDSLREYLRDSSIALNEIRGDIGETLLFNIALIKDEQKALEMMKFMIEEQGLIAYSEDDLQQTVLYYVCREGKTNCIDYLIERGCSINQTDTYQQTPLYYAVRDNRLETVEKLIQLCGSEEEAKKYVNHRDVENESAIFYACIEGHADMVRLLIKHGADYRVENKSGQSLLNMCERKHPDLEEYLLSLGVQKGSLSKKNKKKSGRPANVNTKKMYALCTMKDGEWTVATGDTQQERAIFNTISDMDQINKWVDEYKAEMKRKEHENAAEEVKQ